MRDPWTACLTRRREAGLLGPQSRDAGITLAPTSLQGPRGLIGPRGSPGPLGRPVRTSLSFYILFVLSSSLSPLHVHSLLLGFSAHSLFPLCLSVSQTQAPPRVSALVSHPLLPQGVIGSDGAPGAKGNVVRVPTPDACFLSLSLATLSLCRCTGFFLVASGGYSLVAVQTSHCSGFSCCRARRGSRRTGSRSMGCSSCGTGTP